jgi:anti-sigma B factor antagonist
LIEITQPGSSKKANGAWIKPSAQQGPAPDPDEPSPVIDVQVSSPAKGLSVLHVAGEIDMLTAPVLDSMVVGQLKSLPHVLVLDLHEVGFMSSAGLASLVTAREQAGKAGTALRLVATGDPVLRPLTVTGLTAIFEIHSDMEAALAT